MTYMIEARGLRKQYGDYTAVDGASFNINPGEVVGFLGPNGAGKTTTIKMITGLLMPDAGEALIAGLDINKEPLKAKAQFAYVPDTPNLYGKLKAIEYLRFMAQLYRVPTDEADERIKQMLDLFELSDKAGTYLDGFSHGMQQKVAIIGAMLHNPKVIFLDEPTVGLDPRSARLVKDLLSQHADNGNAVFFSSHILEIVENMCDRVIIISKGKILADAPVVELREMKGDQSLEDIFLELTGGKDVDDMVKELANAS
jgi:ABC-2 type transport system ATP-binding protein